MNRTISGIRYITQVFKQHFFSSRTVGFLALQFFVLHVFLSPLRDFCVSVNYPVSLWSIIFVFTSPYFAFFFIAGIIYFYSNVPYMHYAQTYQIIRTGRLKWLDGKIANVLLSAVCLGILEVLLSFIPLIGAIHFEPDWGKVLYTLSMTDAVDSLGLSFTVPYDILMYYNPRHALLLIIFILILVIAFIGLLMFCISLYFSRMTAVNVAMGMNILQIVVLNMSYRYRWLNFISPISWLDINSISIKDDGKLPTFLFIVIFLILAAVILSVLSALRIKRIDFQWNKED